MVYCAALAEARAPMNCHKVMAVEAEEHHLVAERLWCRCDQRGLRIAVGREAAELGLEDAAKLLRWLTRELEREGVCLS